jgi:HK97 family phage prohead protease
MNQTRAYSVVNLKFAKDSADQRVITGIATTPTPDRVGDIVEPLGCQFKNPLPLLHQHDHEKPVGTVTFKRPTKDGIEFEARIATVEEPGPLRDRVETAWGEIKAGLIRGVSIGFRVLEDGYELMRTGGLRFTKTELMELSLVTVPANADATINTVKSFDRKALAASGQTVTVKAKPAASGITPTATERKKPMARKQTLAEQIAAFKETRMEKSARMTEIMEEAEGSTLDASAQEEFDALEQDITAIDQHVKRLRTLQKHMVEQARPVAGPNDEDEDEGNAVVKSHAPIAAKARAAKPEPGIRMARFAKSLAIANKSHRDVMSVAQELYGERDPEIVSMVKAAVPAATTTTLDPLVGNVGGFADFVEFLRPQTILGKFGTNGVPALRRIPFRVPLITETGESQGYWVGEGKAKPLTSVAYGRAMLEPLKVANIAVATMEALRDTSPAAETLIRDSLAAALIKTQDQAFIDPANAGVPGVRPASITNGVGSAASGGRGADAIREDVRTAMTAFVTANNSLAGGVWIMSASTALSLSLMQNALGQPEFVNLNLNGGTFMGLPVITSEYLGNYIVLVNAGDIYLADDGGIAVDMSTEASLEMADNPAHDSDTPTGAASMVSMFQTNSVAFRAERTVNWMRRRGNGGVRVITGAAWGQPEPETP